MITLDSSMSARKAYVLSDRKFGWFLAVVLTVFSLWPLVFQRPCRIPLLAAAAGLFLIASLKPTWLHWPKVLWVYLTTALAIAVGFLLLCIIFFGVVTPVALFLKVLGRDALKMNWDPVAKSYWVKREEIIPLGPGMRNQY